MHPSAGTESTSKRESRSSELPTCSTMTPDPGDSTGFSPSVSVCFTGGGEAAEARRRTQKWLKRDGKMSLVYDEP